MKFTTSSFGNSEARPDSGTKGALGRPLYKAYESPDLASVAAAYGFGLARNRAFVDGNKRIAFLAMVTLLGLNNIDFVVAESEAVVMMQAIAAGEVDEEGLARWIRDNWPEGT